MLFKIPDCNDWYTQLSSVLRTEILMTVTIMVFLKVDLVLTAYIYFLFANYLLWKIDKKYNFIMIIVQNFSTLIIHSSLCCRSPNMSYLVISYTINNKPINTVYSTDTEKMTNDTNSLGFRMIQPCSIIIVFVCFCKSWKA